MTNKANNSSLNNIFDKLVKKDQQAQKRAKGAKLSVKSRLRKRMKALTRERKTKTSPKYQSKSKRSNNNVCLSLAQVKKTLKGSPRREMNVKVRVVDNGKIQFCTKNKTVSNTKHSSKKSSASKKVYTKKNFLFKSTKGLKK